MLPKPTDSSSKEFFINFLKDKGWSDITDTDTFDKFCYYDISATDLQNRKWRFELKKRNVNSTLYGDTIMEKSKYLHFVSDKDEFDKGALITFFNDKWTFSNVFNPIYFDTKYANATTTFDNNEVVAKGFVHYDQTYTYNYD